MIGKGWNRSSGGGSRQISFNQQTFGPARLIAICTLTNLRTIADRADGRAVRWMVKYPGVPSAHQADDLILVANVLR